MAQSLFEHGRIKTTLPKALEVQPFAEKLITMAKTGSLHARRQVVAKLRDRRLTDENQEFIANESGTDRTVVQKLFADVAPKYADRAGGYTRIIKLPKYRIGDGGDIVVLQLVGEDSIEAEPASAPRKAAGHRAKRAERRKAFAAKFTQTKIESAATPESTATSESEAAAESETPAS